MTTAEKLTPAMKQYYAMKEKAKDAVLFFRMGDFYEMFDDDAVNISKVLGLTLTSRSSHNGEPIPLAGIPYHAAEKYIAELTNKGFKIALCEQLSDPTLPGIVQRDIVRIITPGTVILENDAKLHPQLLCALVHVKNEYACATLDIATGDFLIFHLATKEQLLAEIIKRHPTEILMPQEIVLDTTEQELKSALPDVLLTYKDLSLEPHTILSSHFTTDELPSLTPMSAPTHAAAMVISYVYETQQQHAEHIKLPRIKNIQETMLLDSNTIKHLELFRTFKDEQKEGSVHHLLGHTSTSSGGRLLTQWMLSPLIDKEKIQKRHGAVHVFYKSSNLRKDIRELLHQTSDIERILAKISMQRAHPRDLIALKNTLTLCFDVFVRLKEEAGTEQIFLLIGHAFEETIVRAGQVAALIDASIAEEPPMTFEDLGVIKDGYSGKIDELRSFQKDSKHFLATYIEGEQKKTGISTLKVKYTHAFGYFLEVTKSQLHAVPEYFIRRQTLVQCERYTTPELNEFAEKILSLESELASLEREVYASIRTSLLESLSPLQHVAECIALIDVLATFAHVSFTHNFVAPELHDSREYIIEKGRHPVVEKELQKQGKAFVPNNCSFDEDTFMSVITGPNMAGKSTFLRQIALISYLAQIGCFVPAHKALLPVIDCIFTRIGASDNMSKGSSTFMVEMEEAAHILQSASKQSLIILDEVGRGTSTYDGLSLAWAIIEHVHDKVGAYTLFATHYHELIAVTDTLKHAKNFSASVSEREGSIVFLHKIVEGGATRSYGIEVAKLAGIEKNIIARAEEILLSLENESEKKGKFDDAQLSLFATPHVAPAVSKTSTFEKALLDMNIQEYTPIQALVWLEEQQTLLRKKQL